MPYMTEERRMIQEQAREFTLNEVLPVANKLDPEKGDGQDLVQGEFTRLLQDHAALFGHVRHYAVSL